MGGTIVGLIPCSRHRKGVHLRFCLLSVLGFLRSSCPSSATSLGCLPHPNLSLLQSFLSLFSFFFQKKG